jgi:hypothetical protein
VKRFIALAVVLFFLCFFCSPVSAQCCGGRVRTSAKRLVSPVVRVVNRGSCAARTTASVVKCGTCAAGGLAVDAGRAAIVTVAKPVKAVQKTICVGGQCYR